MKWIVAVKRFKTKNRMLYVFPTKKDAVYFIRFIDWKKYGWALTKSACLAVVLSGCAKAQSEQPQQSTELFNEHGCSVYRFYDQGQPHYFWRC